VNGKLWQAKSLVVAGVAASLIGCGLLPGRRCLRQCTPCCDSVEFAGAAAETIVLSPTDELHEVPEAMEPSLPEMVHEPELQPIPPPKEQPPSRPPSLHVPPTPTKPPTKAEESPDKLALPEPPAKAMKKPGSLSLDVRPVSAVVAVGKPFQIEILVENTGESAIDRTDVTAQFSDNLKIRSVRPENAGKIVGNKVVFETIKNFSPMPLRFQIAAEAVRVNGGKGRIDVDVASPILKAGPLRHEAIVQITD
jgi:hypothetical protein